MTMLEQFLRTDHVSVEKNEEVRKVLGWMRGEKAQRPVILDGKLPYGIPNKNAFMGSRILDGAATAKYTQPTPVPHLTDEYMGVLDEMSKALVPYLPVRQKNGTLAGYVDALDLLRVVGEGPAARAMLHPVPRLHPNDTIGRAIHVYRTNNGADHLPVLDDDGRLVGVLPRRSVIGIEVNRTESKTQGDGAADNEHMLRDTVGDYAEGGVIGIGPEAPYEDVLDRLDASGYALVTEAAADGVRVLGIITPEYAVRAVRPYSETPRSGSRHGAGVRHRQRKSR